ncbi:MAG: tRNA (adenosine(37)-N6)-threonylcarbamoyltransferase complex ATPase subunit type 1 TsaE [Patescibacteria group bacterium]
MKTLLSSSAKETQHFAGKFACDILEHHRKCKDALVVGLKGNLGSGKTTFVQGFARGLGIQEKILSPTFVIIKKYEIRSTKSETKRKAKHVSNFDIRYSDFGCLYHIDCYRIKDEQDLLSLGWDKIVSDPQNLILIEWPERIQKILPKDTVSISFEITKENERRISFL